MRSNLLATCIMMVGALLVSPALAQTKDAPPAAGGDISKRVDPARITPRFFFRNEYRKRQDDSHANTMEGLYEFPITDKIALRTQATLITNNPTQAASDFGFGDITTRLAYTFASGETGSYFVGIEGKFDTAAEPTLGSGKNTLSPVLFASIPLPEYKALFFPIVQTVFTISGEDSRKDVTYTVFKPRVFRKLENRYYLFLEPAFYIDHEMGDKTTGNLEVEFGRFVNAKTMLYGRPGFGVWGDTTPYSFKWNVEVGFRYFIK